MKKKLFLSILSLAFVLALSVSPFAVYAEGEDTASEESTQETVEIAVQKDYKPIYTEVGKPGSTFEKIGETSSLRLYMQETEMIGFILAVEDKKSGKVTYSVPNDVLKFGSFKTARTYADLATITYMEEGQSARAFIGTGESYVNSDFTTEMIENGVKFTFKFTQEEAALFTLPIQFRLVDDHLDASIDMNGIKKDKKCTSEILCVSILKYFGCATNSKADEGFLFIPDGSGALIANDYSPINGAVKEYSSFVYGRDEALNKRSSIGNIETTNMPVFGIKKGDSAVFGIVSSGDAVARVVAQSARNSALYAYNYIDFTYKLFDTFKTGSSWFVKEYPKTSTRPTNLDAATVSYYFLAGEDADIVGMASVYRNYLLANGAKNNADADIKLYVDSIGAITKSESRFGFIVDSTKAATTTKQFASIAESLKKAGVTNLSMRYRGWQSGGIETSISTNANVESVIGGKSGMRALDEKMGQLGVEYSLDTDFVNFFSGKVGWAASKVAARDALDDYAKQYVYTYNSGSIIKDNYHYLLAPTYFSKLVNSFTKSYDKLGLKNASGISAGSFGEHSYSNLIYKSKSFCDAQETANYMKESLTTLKNKYKKVTVDGGNAYTFTVADNIIGINLYSNGYNLCYTDVPFMQLALHGLVNYTETAHNLTTNPTTQLLRQLETGANPYYLITGNGSEVFVETNYDYIVSSQYETWKDTMIDSYKTLSEVLNGYGDQFITDYQFIDKSYNVRATTYGDKLTVYVNYGSTDYTLPNGTVVKAGSYTTEQKGAAK